MQGSGFSVRGMGIIGLERAVPQATTRGIALGKAISQTSATVRQGYGAGCGVVAYDQVRARELGLSWRCRILRGMGILSIWTGRQRHVVSHLGKPSALCHFTRGGAAFVAPSRPFSFQGLHSATSAQFHNEGTDVQLLRYTMKAAYIPYRTFSSPTGTALTARLAKEASALSIPVERCP